MLLTLDQNFISDTCPDQTQPPLQWVLGVKWPGHTADHSCPPCAEVKNAWSYTFPPICLHDVVLN